MPSLHVHDESDVIRWGRILARGADARQYLQGQLSCDLDSLKEGAYAQGLLLSPSGDVITSLTCVAQHDGIDVEVRYEDLDRTMSALRRFLLRTRCELSADISTDLCGGYETYGEQVARGVPGPAEFERGLAPHSFGRDYVSSHVSFTKGCFTGQELVGRLDARGANVPFRFARISGSDVAKMTEVVESVGPSGDRASQGLTTVVRGENVRALGIVHRSLVGEERDVIIDGVRVEVLHDTGKSAR